MKLGMGLSLSGRSPVAAAGVAPIDPASYETIEGWLHDLPVEGGSFNFLDELDNALTEHDAVFKTWRNDGALGNLVAPDVTYNTLRSNGVELANINNHYHFANPRTISGDLTFFAVGSRATTQPVVWFADDKTSGESVGAGLALINTNVFRFRSNDAGTASAALNVTGNYLIFATRESGLWTIESTGGLTAEFVNTEDFTVGQFFANVSLSAGNTSTRTRGAFLGTGVVDAPTKAGWLAFIQQHWNVGLS